MEKTRVWFKDSHTGLSFDNIGFLFLNTIPAKDDIIVFEEKTYTVLRREYDINNKDWCVVLWYPVNI
jgi:hypothetical protein